MKSILKSPFHPIFFSVYPILALLAYNISQVDYWVALRPILFSVAFTIVYVSLLFVILRNLTKAAIIGTATILLFFSYGHLYNLIRQSPINDLLGHHVIVGGFFLAIFGIVTWITLRIKKLDQVTTALNVISIFLVIISVVPVIYYVTNLRSAVNRQSSRIQGTLSPIKPLNEMPDIYYIILDSYTRDDALLDDFGLDTSPFLNQMKNEGFYLADCARSNYSFTELSMASAFNMDYVTNLNSKAKPGNSDLTIATAMIKNGIVRRQLEAMGYKTVAFETGYAWNHWNDADLFLSPTQNEFLISDLQPFEYMLIDESALSLVNDFFPKLIKSLDQSSHHSSHIKRTLFELENLTKLPESLQPKFVYAHINVPHVPFVFKANGELLNNPKYFRGKKDYPVSEEYFLAGYSQQVQFINNQISTIVDTIIKNSNIPPIIIIQGDHGIRDKNRFEILNLYRFPGIETAVYPSITPVNTFRVLFNSYFNGKYPLIEDRSYLSTSELPYDLTEVFETSERCKPQ